MGKKTTSTDLPPRMLRRVRTLKSGKMWVGYYYDATKQNGKQKQIPLGTDLDVAKRKWAALETNTTWRAEADDSGNLDAIFDQYYREILPTKTQATQRNYIANLKTLREVFGAMHIDEVKPVHVAQFRKIRSQKAQTVANREMALFSSIFNYAREWGYTSNENPCRGVKRNKETPRDYYVEDDVWSAVQATACQELLDAMDLAYITGQRPADVLKMQWSDIRGGTLEIRQNKTKKRLRILIEGELAKLLARIHQRPVLGMTILVTAKGERLSNTKLRSRFDAARAKAAEEAEAARNKDLAARIRAFQFRDTRAKAASDTTLDHASAMLGHTGSAITERVYRRLGEIVKPLK